MLNVINFVKEHWQTIALIVSLVTNLIKFTNILDKVSRFCTWLIKGTHTGVKYCIKAFYRLRWADRKIDLRNIGTVQYRNALLVLCNELRDGLFIDHDIKTQRQLNEYIREFETSHDAHAVAMLMRCRVVLKDKSLLSCVNQLLDVIGAEPNEDFNAIIKQFDKPIHTTIQLIESYQAQIDRIERKWHITI